ncbi:putative gamma-glutamyltranspeptidase protein [Phaeoacremonium minimum UCRPA7]|uniref:Putative gamma-glutamyltranspeptidase protein n=1 Tax=Phaeoacremonium minimum (strain UCR-PA7) TaxID=1286976 RepID=R8BT19_PHAM7|nr:putative gamma-glutamyltranspeptidase protein [Phaeoacremonium minimum UCRPA7]EOO02415.1 putative gamma-glutamyltranspeptidase protein [Phaeoacremonium minimum UCRPA7]
MASSNNPFVRFSGRRSVVHSTKGIVACTQPLAAEAGQRILKLGGNAADAAIAVAAAMNMTEPASTGLGGDMFCLYFDAKTKEIHALNGSGRSAKNSTLEQIKADLNLPKSAGGKIPITSPLSITVPGAPAGWVDAFEKFGSGRLSLEQVLMPAIELGEQGFPVSEISARMWQNGEAELKQASPNFQEMLKYDDKAENSARAPMAGEILKNPTLAQSFRTLATEGKKGFYTGRIAQAIVDIVKSKGGYLELSDFEDHLTYGTQKTQPVSLKFRGQGVRNRATRNSEDHFFELWEHPPNGQGIVALMALGILEELERNGEIPTFTTDDHNTAPYLHALIESLRIAFADATWWITDPEHSSVSPAHLVSREYLAKRAKLFNKAAAGTHGKGQPGPSPAQNHSDTVYFAVTDAEGNGMSFINSIFREFGSAIIPQGCGFTLQNRGSNFDLGPADHPNIYAGGKRPYHTIIPGLITTGEGTERQLDTVYGVMGGLMQPQGHVQLLLNMEVFGMNPQEALDAPRVCIAGFAAPGGDKDMGTIWIEEGISEEVLQQLRAMGHDARLLQGWNRNWFGRGQVVRRRVDEMTGQAVYSGASDYRGDGCAFPA